MSWSWIQVRFVRGVVFYYIRSHFPSAIVLYLLVSDGYEMEVEQSESCGRQGRGITIPGPLLSLATPSNTSSRLEDKQRQLLVEQLVNSWIDFRFGVFDFPGTEEEKRRDGGAEFERVSNVTVDGVSVSSDQLRPGTRHHQLCHGRTYEEVIGEHPDTRGTAAAARIMLTADFPLPRPSIPPLPHPFNCTFWQC